MGTNDGERPHGGLEGKAVLVSGGGTGIGRAAAERLAHDGAAVTICGRTESKLVDSTERIDADCGGSVRHVVADVTVEADVEAATAAAVEPTGSLDGVFANAGGGGGIAPLHRQETDEFVRVLHVNLLGTALCVKHAVPRLVAAGGGSFVGMSSLAGSVTHKWFGAYGPAKAGIEQLMRDAADEYGETGVRFNTVCPGFITTEIMEGIPRDSSVYESYIRNTPMGDVGRPEDVADLVRFLIGSESRWITGQSIAVDGGHSLRTGPDFTMFTGLGDDELVARD